MNRLELKAVMAATIAAGRRASESGETCRQNRSHFAQYVALDTEAVLQAIEARSTNDDNQPVVYVADLPPDPSRSRDGIEADYVCLGGMILEGLRDITIERCHGETGYILRDTGPRRHALYTVYIGPVGVSVFRAIADDKGYDLADEKLIVQRATLDAGYAALLADHRAACPEIYED